MKEKKQKERKCCSAETERTSVLKVDNEGDMLM